MCSILFIQVLICLLFGYVREINIKNQIIPSSIILLCIKFYHSSFRIIYINCTTWNATYPQIRISHLDHQNTFYKTNLKPLNINETTKSQHRVYDRGVCFICPVSSNICRLSHHNFIVLTSSNLS